MITNQPSEVEFIEPNKELMKILKEVQRQNAEILETNKDIVRRVINPPFVMKTKEATK